MSNSLEQKVASLEADVHNLNGAVGKLTTAVERLSERISINNSTNWNVLGIWAGVIVSILGGLGYLALNPVRYTTQRIDDKFYYHEHSEGHAKSVMQIKALEKRIDAIENEQRSRTHKVYSK